MDRLVLVGQVTEQCVLYPALDARIRRPDGRVPPDAVAHIHRDLADAALRMMGLPMMGLNRSAEVCPAGKVSF